MGSNRSSISRKWIEELKQINKVHPLILKSESKMGRIYGITVRLLDGVKATEITGNWLPPDMKLKYFGHRSRKGNLCVP